MTVVTRWWWLRHAPVTLDAPGRIAGQIDYPCDLSDAACFARLQSHLPEDAVWVISHLDRSRITADALQAPPRQVEPGIAEQNLGAWQGLTWDDVFRDNAEAHNDFWSDPGSHRPPGGESFADVCARVATAVDRLTEAHSGRDIVAVGHGGSIRAALAQALELDPRSALAFQVDNLSLTRLDHVVGTRRERLRGAWRVMGVNLRI
jgi:alpha-ribazole phosphatase